MNLLGPPRVLKGGVGSVNRRRPLKPLEEHVGVFENAKDMLLRTSKDLLIFNLWSSTPLR
ncbi:MAG: hypothetical protein R2825_22450 [Saprospiraceae bacterium]